MLPVVSVVLSFFVILGLIRWKVPIGLAMLAGAIISAIGGGLFGRPMLEVTILTLSSPTTWELALTIGFVSALGKIMEKAGLLTLLIENLRKIIRDTRIILVALPSLIGMLMFPGGAILSAPMVGELGNLQKMNSAEKTFANLMFRHLWHLIFPLIPSMILASQLARVNPLGIVAFNLPLALVAFFVTFAILFRGRGMGKNEDYEGFGIGAVLNLIKALGPMLLAIILGLVLDIYFPLALGAGILLVYVYLWMGEKLSFLKYLVFLFKSVNWNIFLAIFPIIYFKDVLEVGGAVEQVAFFFQDQGIPLPFLMIFVPFIGGFFTGSNTANIGISFPLLLPMFPADNYVIYVGFAYLSGVVGYLVSPVHLCMILTKDYFQCELGKLYQVFLIPNGAVMFAAIILFMFLR